ncbi:DUF2314 domain-containing protein [Sinisalibacter aestuarii]|uniref:DUF2314 domain-containing protein n=1 Tax=Sinisalibacter aestuarii TaxID=2949426 RepID=A0ABQ5LWW4_9RHOB|nr:DUF2314 domain-containing protein [Sinisalibacter aestuarii]GKY89464.1 hypothetical protein STA1M1_33330 [Sinisalibacter aestuarii]
MLRLASLTLALALSLAALAPASAQDDVISYGSDDPAMNEAIRSAQSHLGRVLVAAINEVGVAHPALSLKVAFPVEAEDMNAEVIWVDEISLAQEGMAGKLANEPVNMPGLHLGDEVHFSQEMIYDWGLVGPDGKVFGHYTTRVLIETLPEAQAAPIREALSDTPLPAAWQE